MNKTNYFSKDEDKQAQFAFNLIAPAYDVLDKDTYKYFKDMATLFNSHTPLKDKAVLDLCRGTRAWKSALNQYKLLKAVGADFSKKMIRQAEKKHPEIKFVHQHGENLEAFANNSLDIVTATFVLHGMKKEKRTKVINEMKRIAGKWVVIHDFYSNRHPFVQLPEFLKRSDYRYFQKHFAKILSRFFPKGRYLPAITEMHCILVK